ncbi:MAG: photosystem II biogenesis protein Psp29 [Oscillatoria sp. PMC 1051.18]|nr:photosystem II biogenesis protein Psp29 [Oscillatoria sp. PMC 1050.18]MEC5030220.1 photosystem II biogenesis protein Psp29 [Oscillatoria sp. PMC 1051.18]
MDKVRTVSDTKRDFYNHHTRPINSIYRRVVDELIVEMHLLSVNSDFHYDPIYALGVVTSFEKFMQGYRPEEDKESIFQALCRSVGDDPQQYRQDAERLLAFAKSRSGKELVSWLVSPTPVEGAGDLMETVQEISADPKYKYSRLFAIGLYTLLQEADPELVKEEKQRDRLLQEVGDALNLPQEKLLKDLELYRGNLEKMTQGLSAIEDALRDARKKREQRAQEKKQAESN